MFQNGYIYVKYHLTKYLHICIILPAIETIIISVITIAGE